MLQYGRTYAIAMDDDAEMQYAAPGLEEFKVPDNATGKAMERSYHSSWDTLQKAAEGFRDTRNALERFCWPQESE